MQETSLQQVRRTAHEEVLKVASRLSTRARRASVDQAIANHAMGSTSPRPIEDNRCRTDQLTKNNTLSPIPNHGIPKTLSQTKQHIKSMVTNRIQHHRQAELAIQKAEDILIAKHGSNNLPTKLLDRINQAIQPLESKAASKRIQHAVRRKSLAVIGALSAFASPSTFSPSTFSPNVKSKGEVAKERINGMASKIRVLEEYSVSTPELQAALQILAERTNVRAKKVEKELEEYKINCLTKDEAKQMFPTKKNNSKMLERMIEMSTNQVRTVIGSEIRSILKNEWNDMVGNSLPVEEDGDDGKKKKQKRQKEEKITTTTTNIIYQ